MAKVVDLRGKTMGGRDKRTKVTKIARHHSATTEGHYDSFARFWSGTRGWNTGGYHEIILRDGTVQLCYDWDTVTNGVYGHNQNTYHICLVGNGSFTEAQEIAFEERAKAAIALFRLRVSDVLGHNEFSGTNTSCPGINMNTVRSRLNGKSVSPAPKPKTGSSTTVNLLRKGSKGKSVTQLQKDLIAAGEKLPKFGADGHFGDETEKAVRSLQKKGGIAVDGIVGPNTRKAITSRKKSTSKPKTTSKLPNAVYNAKRPYPSGSGVKAVQQALASKHYYPDKGAKNNGIDGVYGPKTANAVKRFQSMHGLKPDGVYGPNTKKELEKAM